MLGKVVIPVELELQLNGKQEILIRAFDDVLMYVSCDNISNISHLLARVKRKVEEKHIVPMSEEEKLGLK